MIVFDEKQKKDLRGHYTAIARSCGVTREYVSMILKSVRNQRSKKSQEIARKAKAILDILYN